jgi:hypothetical protein
VEVASAVRVVPVRLAARALLDRQEVLAATAAAPTEPSAVPVEAVARVAVVAPEARVASRG